MSEKNSRHEEYMKNKKKILIVIASLVCLGVLMGIGFGIILPNRQQAIMLEQTETQAANATAQEIAFVQGMTSTAYTWTKTPPPTSTFTPTVTSTATITPTITPTLGIGSTRVRESDGMVQVYVPEGEFTMGDDYAWPHVKPEHLVYLDGFWIDQTEMTNGRYQKCVDEGACIPPLEINSFYVKEYFGNPKYDDYPVVYMSWDNAKDYCLWAGADLPTEAQWEKAARSDDKRAYPWGNQEPVWNFGNILIEEWDTEKVGSYPLGASPYGALDMAGNVYEWVNDYFAFNYYEISPYENPTGPTEFPENEIGVHILRGGAWASGAGHLLTYQHLPIWPNYYLPTMEYGFRCANNE